MVTNLSLEELKQTKDKIIHQSCEKEFNELGYAERLNKLKIPYFLHKRTPLHKNKFVVSMKHWQYNTILNSNKIFIVAITNSKKVDKNIFYVFSKDKLHFSSGYTPKDRYFHFMLSTGGIKEFLPTIEEYLLNKEGIKSDKSI